MGSMDVVFLMVVVLPATSKTILSGLLVSNMFFFLISIHSLFLANCNSVCVAGIIYSCGIGLIIVVLTIKSFIFSTLPNKVNVGN